MVGERWFAAFSSFSANFSGHFAVAVSTFRAIDGRSIRPEWPCENVYRTFSAAKNQRAKKGDSYAFPRSFEDIFSDNRVLFDDGIV
jgi:hypothetical protein